MSSQVVRPYNAKFLPDDRKHKMLTDTINQLDKISSKHFDLLVAFYGSIQHKHVSINDKQEEHITPDSVCAINWFRPMSKDYAKYQVKIDSMITNFKEYAGHIPDKYAIEYMGSNIDTDRFVWVDCRNFAKDYVRNMDMSFSEFQNLVDALVFCKILALNESTSTNWAWGAISAIYGGGDKEDSQFKAKVLNTFVKALNDENNKTKFDVINKVCSDLGYNDHLSLIEDFRSTIDENGNKKSASGSPPAIAKFTEDGEISDNYRRACISSFSKTAKEKQDKKSIPHLDILKTHMIAMCGEYNTYAWTEAIKNANTDITSRNTRNMTFIKEKIESRNSLKIYDTEENMKAAKILNGINHKLTPDLHYTPAPKHLGKNLKDLFEMLEEKNILAQNEKEKKAALDECIKQYIDDCKGLNQQPIASLLAHISNYHKEITAENFLDGAKLLVLLQKINRQKAHPSVFSPKAYTWGSKLEKNRRAANSALLGWIVPPEEKHKDRHAGQHPVMWVTMTLLNDGKWEKHHVPFTNSRFFSEVYAYQPELPYKEGGYARNSKTATKPSQIMLPAYAESMRHHIATKGNGHKKSEKIVLRALSNIRHNVRFDPSTSFFVRIMRDKKGNHRLDTKGRITFGLQINHRITVGKTKSEINIGDRLLAFDQNQSENHTFAIMQRVEDNTPNSHQFNGWNIRVLETGKVVSMTKGIESYYDQLSYDGVPYETKKFEDWRNERKAFVKKNKDIVIKEEKTFGQMFAEIKKSSLYKWNLSYLKILRMAIRAKSGDTVSLFREELISIAKNRFGPLGLGSLSASSLKMLGAFCGVIQSYFSVLNCLDDKDKSNFDSELYFYLVSAFEKRVFKRNEKTSRASSFIMAMAYNHGCKMIVCEDDLPTAGAGANKRQNSDRMDWCARSLAQKIKTGCEAMSIAYRAIPAYMSSHQDPLVHLADGKTSVLCPRFALVSKDDIKQYQLDGMRRMLNSKSKIGTAVYYRAAVELLCKELGINKTDIAKGKLSVSQFADIVNGEILLPQRGGRVYLATKELTNGAKLVSYNGSDVWLSNADEIAAINIGMFVVCTQTGVFGKKKKKDEQDGDSEIA